MGHAGSCSASVAGSSCEVTQPPSRAGASRLSSAGTAACRLSDAFAEEEEDAAQTAADAGAAACLHQPPCFHPVRMHAFTAGVLLRMPTAAWPSMLADTGQTPCGLMGAGKASQQCLLLRGPYLPASSWPVLCNPPWPGRTYRG